MNTPREVNKEVNEIINKVGLLTLSEQKEAMDNILRLVLSTARIFNDAINEICENLGTGDLKTVLLEEVSGMGEDIKNLKDVFIDVKKEETNTENLSKGYNLFLEKKGLPSETVVVEDHYQFLERKIAESRNAIFPSEEIFTTKIIEKFNAFSPLEKASQIAVGENDGEQYYANVLRVFNAFDEEIKVQYLYLQYFMIEHINLDEHTTDEHIGHGKALYPLINKTPDKDIQDFYVNNFKSFKNIRRAISKSS